MRIVIAGALLLLLSRSMPAQSRVVFEVASVKASKTVPPEGRWRAHIEPSPAALTIRSHTLRDCIEWAWGLKSYQLSGPAWIDIDTYDIVAKAPGPTPPDRLRRMLQALLTDRFELALRRETRDLPVYLLTVAKGGPKLRPSQADTSDIAKLPGPGLRLSFRRASLAQLADFLSTLAALDRPVLDATGLDRLYDFELDLPSAAEGVSVEQLGLKLDPRKQPVEVLIVERARRIPIPNP